MMLQGSVFGREDARCIPAAGERGLVSAQVIKASVSPALGAGPSIWDLKKGDGGEGVTAGGSSADQGTEKRKCEVLEGTAVRASLPWWRDLFSSLLLSSSGEASRKLWLVQ